MTSRRKTRIMVGLAILVGFGVFAGANAHLIWTSVQSQPDCVPHLTVPDQSGQYRAARSSC